MLFIKLQNMLYITYYWTLRGLLTNNDFHPINKAPGAIHGQLDQRTQKEHLKGAKLKLIIKTSPINPENNCIKQLLMWLFNLILGAVLSLLVIKTAIFYPDKARLSTDNDYLINLIKLILFHHIISTSFYIVHLKMFIVSMQLYIEAC